MKVRLPVLLTILSALIPGLILFGMQPASADPGTLTVTIKTRDNKVLPDARVTINGTITATTDSNGVASFGNVNLYANHSIEVRYKDFLVYEQKKFNASGSTTATFTVSVSDWNIKLYDSSGKNPVPGATIKLRLNVLTEEERTDSSGLAKFGNMPWSSGYELKVFYRGREVHSESYALNDASRSISVNVRLYMLMVIVKDVRGQPVRGADVKVWNASKLYPVYATGTTDAKGNATLRFLVGENYITEVSYKGDLISNKTINVSSDTSDVVTANLLSVNITVYNFKGNRIIAGGNYALKGILYRDGQAYSDEVSTNDGILRLGHAYYPRDYRLVVKIAGVEVYNNIYELRADTASGSIRAKFYDMNAVISKGNLLDEKLADRLRIILRIDTAFEVSFMTERGMAKVLNLPAADYQYIAYYDGYQVGSGTFRLTIDDEAVSLGLNAYKLNVRVLNKEDGPVPASVTISTYDRKLLKSIMADEDGFASFEGLLPIKYSLVFKHLGKEVGRSDVDIYQDTSLTVNTEVYNFRANVFDYDGVMPLDGCSVILRLGEFTLSNNTDPNGFVIVKNAPMAEYDLSVILYGIVIYEGKITVRSGNPVIIDKTDVYDVVVKVYDAERMSLQEGKVNVVFSGLEKTADVGPDGKARIENVPRWRLLIRYSLYGIQAGELDASLEYDEQTFELTARVYPVILSYKMGDEKPMTEGYVSLEHQGTELLRQELDRMGRVSLRVPAGSYSFVAYYKGVEVSSYELSVYGRVSESIVAAVYLTEFVLKGLDGKPIGNASLLLTMDGSAFLRASTGPDGSASFYLPRGDYVWTVTLGDVQLVNATYSAKENNSIRLIYIPERSTEYYAAISSLAAAMGIVGFSVYKGFFRGRPSRGARMGMEVRRRPKTPRI